MGITDIDTVRKLIHNVDADGDGRISTYFLLWYRHMYSYMYTRGILLIYVYVISTYIFLLFYVLMLM